MSTLPPCPGCSSPYTYEDRGHCVCPECAHRWQGAIDTGHIVEARAVKDAHDSTLTDGDAVIVIKDLKVRGTSSVVKVGTKVKNIRLVDGDHDIDCRIEGIGAMQLKSEFVRKA